MAPRIRFACGNSRLWIVMRWLPLAAILTTVPASATQQRQASPQNINQCVVGGTAVNYGLISQNCTTTSDEMVLIRPRPGQPDRPLRDTDGTYVREFVYRIPEPLTFETNQCSPALVSVAGVSLSGTPVASRQLPSRGRDCITVRFMEVSGEFALLIRTADATSTVTISIIIPPPPPPAPPPPVPAPSPPPLPPPPP